MARIVEANPVYAPDIHDRAIDVTLYGEEAVRAAEGQLDTEPEYADLASPTGPEGDPVRSRTLGDLKDGDLIKAKQPLTFRETAEGQGGIGTIPENGS